MTTLFAIVLASLVMAPGDEATPPPDENAKRIEAVKTYLLPDNTADQRQALKQLSEATPTQVADALANWRDHCKVEQEFQTLKINIPTGKRKPPKELIVEVKTPQEFKARTAYPLLIALHGQGGNGKQFLRAVVALLGEQSEGFIIAAPTDYNGMWLGASELESAEPNLLLDRLKRSFPIDTDRIYAMGYSIGGHASFLLATFYKDQIAATVSLAGTCAIQMGAECLDVLLPNIHNTPVLAVYGENDQSKDPTTNKPAGIAIWNRYIEQQAAKLNLPITMIELPGVGHGGVIPPKDQLKAYLTTKRAPLSKQVSHRFRYTSQARDGWLRQIKFLGRRWDSQQLIVSPANGETVAEAMAAMLEQKLGYLGGTIDGQTINIDTRKCSRIEVLLNDDLVDLDQPIKIVVDGTVRFEGLAKRSVKTMLEIAKEDWEFQRLFPVRFQIARKGKAVQR